MEMIIPTARNLRTGSAGTAEWLEASKNMRIMAYTEGITRDNVALGTSQNEEEAVVGTHLKEAATTLRKIFKL